jgi:hypothetical protein
MTSLEVLILTAFTLLIVFAALPYVIGMLHSSLAPLEYRTAAGYVLAFADSLEADFGMAGERKYFSLPRFVYGSFGPVNRTYTLQLLGCGPLQTFRWNSAELWYNATYLVGERRLLRGLSAGLTARPPDTLMAVEALESGIRAYPRVFIVSGKGEAYVYIINATVRLSGAGTPAYVTYEMSGLRLVGPFSCRDPKLVVPGAPAILGSGDTNVYIVIQNATVWLR